MHGIGRQHRQVFDQLGGGPAAGDQIARELGPDVVARGRGMLLVDGDDRGNKGFAEIGAGSDFFVRPYPPSSVRR